MCLMGCWDVGHMTNYQKWSKTKVVALHCSFLNLVELCSEVLLLWRYEVKDFEKHRFFFVFCIFLNENKTKQHDFTTFRKLKERATIIVLWEKWPKKEGACPKRGTGTDRLQKLAIKFTNELQETTKSQRWTTKLADRLERRQKSDLDYKLYW